VVSLNIAERLPAADDMSISRRATFGQLTSLIAPIDYIFQLLSSFTGYLPQLRFISVHASIPSLRDLSIHTGIYTGRPPHHQSISDLISSAVFAYELYADTSSTGWQESNKFKRAFILCHTPQDSARCRYFFDR
jgi:hypothetical protein